MVANFGPNVSGSLLNQVANITRQLNWVLYRINAAMFEMEAPLDQRQHTETLQLSLGNGRLGSSPCENGGKLRAADSTSGGGDLES